MICLLEKSVQKSYEWLKNLEGACDFFQEKKDGLKYFFYKVKKNMRKYLKIRPDLTEDMISEVIIAFYSGVKKLRKNSSKFEKIYFLTLHISTHLKRFFMKNSTIFSVPECSRIFQKFISLKKNQSEERAIKNSKDSFCYGYVFQEYIHMDDCLHL